MVKGPSPVIPLLLVVALGLLLRSNSFPLTLNLNLPLVSEAENAILMFVLFIPILVIMAIYSASHTILLPIAVVLTMYTVSTILLGPLMLISIVYLAGGWLPAFKCNGEELGWGCLAVLVFFLVQWALSDEGRQSGALVLAIVVLLCYHFSS